MVARPSISAGLGQRSSLLQQRSGGKTGQGLTVRLAQPHQGRVRHAKAESVETKGPGSFRGQVGGLGPADPLAGTQPPCCGTNNAAKGNWLENRTAALSDVINLVYAARADIS